MSAPATIPACFLARARRHLRRTGQPLLLSPRRRCDTGLLIARNPASQRWAVLLDPRSVPVLFDELVDIVDDHAEQSERFTDVMLRLSKYAAVAVDGLPSRFESGGLEVGRVEVADHCCVFASSALAVSCLSWVMRQQGTGFYLRNEPDVP